jgi:hypothetical protein
MEDVKLRFSKFSHSSPFVWPGSVRNEELGLNATILAGKERTASVFLTEELAFL